MKKTGTNSALMLKMDLHFPELTEYIDQTCMCLQTQLVLWFDQNARPMPWRGSKDPYTVWLSEILLQQTRVNQALPYFERFVEAFPTVYALASADFDQVLKLWEGVGYYSRARNLYACARVVVEQHNGIFPSDIKALRSLPGIGPYTAGAIASIAFDLPEPLVDGNVARVFTRVYDIDLPIDSKEGHDILWQIAQKIMPDTMPGKHNQALMELGATLCTPRNPDCGRCPVHDICLAKKRITFDKRPVRTPRKQPPLQQHVAALIQDDNQQYLVAKRPENGLLAGLWEFPSGVICIDESHDEALRRILRNDWEIDVLTGEMEGVVDHAYTHFKVRLHAYPCSIKEGTPHPQHHVAMAWVTLDEIEQLALPRIVHKLLEHIGK